VAFFRFVGFSGVRAWQGFWRNAMMSLATTATVILMLVLLAGLFIVITGLNSGLEFIESKVAVTARLVGPPEKEALTQPQLDA
jgi:cell division protein FtsX